MERDLEWCRKAKYQVFIELGCYKITDQTPLMEGFIEKEFDGEKYAVKSGYNVLEQNYWETSPKKPYIITGTVNERWPVKPENLKAYNIDRPIGIVPEAFETLDPVNQEFMVACKINEEEKDVIVVPSWAFGENGIDKSQVMIANSPFSKIDHNGGDYIVAKHIPGKPEYMQLSEKERNTKEAAKLYDPRIINGSIMSSTYDHAKTQDEIKEKYTESKRIA